MAKRVDPPVPIMTVLNHALMALGTDKRFRQVPNGHLEVAWRQATPGRNGGRATTGSITVECSFDPEAEKASVGSQERL